MSKYVGYSYDTTKSGDYFSHRLRPTGIMYPGGDTVSYSYGLIGLADDLLNRPVSVLYNNVDQVTYEYQGLATPITVNCPQASLSLDYTQSDALDNFNRITRQMWKGVFDINVVDIKHDYDRSGNRTNRIDTVGGASFDEFYAYDGMNQLINRATELEREHFNYDATGNHVQTTNGSAVETQSFNKANEIIAINGNTNAVANDRNGNMTRIPHYDLTYDAWNRLVRVSNNGTTIAEYQYNALNHRIVKTTPTETRYYYFNRNWQCVEEYTDDFATTDIKYVWGLRYIDDMLCRVRSTETLYPVADANWNVVALVDSTGIPVERYTYDAFGGLHIYDASFNERPQSLYNWTRTFTGQVLDLDTGLMLYRNRYYSPELGRFITRDPIGYEGGDVSLYSIVKNNVVHKTDQSGLFVIPIMVVPPDQLNPVPEPIFVASPATIGKIQPVPSVVLTDKEVCEIAQKRKKKGILGNVLRYKGRIIPCTYKKIRQDENKKGDTLISECVLEHELFHIKQLTMYSHLYFRYIPIEQNDEIEVLTIIFKNQSLLECEAYKESLKCLEEKKKFCKTDCVCTSLLEKRIETVKGIMNIKFSCNSFS